MEVKKYSRYLFAGVVFVSLIITFFLITSVFIDSIFDKVVVLGAVVAYPIKKCNPNISVSLNFTVNNLQAQCYRSCSNQSLPYISNKLNEKERPIFFIESSCKSNDAGKIVLNPRQACSIESAAKQNPQRQIYVMFVSSADVEKKINSNIITDPMIRVILDYPNVAFKHINIETYVDDSPIAPLFAKGHIENSKWPIEHTSDALRLLTLWRYGGIYLDLDIVSMKSLDELNESFGVFARWDTLVAYSVMGYKQDGMANEFLERCLEDARDNYNGQDWLSIGATLLTRNFFKLCNLTMERQLENSTCGIKIYHKNTFFSIDLEESNKFFDETNADEVMRRINGSVGIHLWNHGSSGQVVDKNSNCSYMQIARKYCPGVYDAAPEIFG